MSIRITGIGSIAGAGKIRSTRSSWEKCRQEKWRSVAGRDGGGGPKGAFAADRAPFQNFVASFSTSWKYFSFTCCVAACRFSPGRGRCDGAARSQADARNASAGSDVRPGRIWTEVHPAKEAPLFEFDLVEAKLLGRGSKCFNPRSHHCKQSLRKWRRSHGHDSGTLLP